MGYYTDFSLYAKTLRTHKPVSQEVRGEINDYFEAQGDNSQLFYLEWSIFNQYWYDHAKWYDRDEEMKELSKCFPDVVFWLEGMGEDADEKWREYYWNGNEEDAKVTTTYSECPW